MTIVRVATAPLRGLEEAGTQSWFYVRAYGMIPLTLKRHKREVFRVLAEVSFGTGALAVIGGTVVVCAFLTSFAGIELGIQGFNQLSNIGVEALSGFVSAYINTRLAAPIIAGIALVATIGAGFTAQLGAMRVSEEIDALDVMAVPSVPFLVTTRIIAGSLAVIPIYALSLLAAYTSTELVVTGVYGQSAGAYGHYFKTFLIPSDILNSFLMVLIMSVVVMSIHCYYGFFASGGPAGVGAAVGRAVRLSLIAVLFTNLLLSMVLYGNSHTLHISG
ncbi:ABC transporter permease [Amycolatopsis sp.]|uniref:ABC transporter permease n=1 Tax=Amycolatopsis sp. TaxID=37632 RepID=UPI002C580CA5|nr:ABC transporter permease [Amycolatopsis sp.]HVV12671.1 ABC transporter permease [Amycolatopsis sp.]